MPELKHSFAEGELVGDNYRILSVAGTGGMGVVYRALDLRLERVVALKFLPAELNASQRDRDRFLREARTASSLDHPNIGVIHGVEQTPDGLTFIVMAFYEGNSLGQRLARGPLPAHEAVDIGTQMARGLAEAHSRGIIHRDVKPSNVMLTGTGLVKIVDFGLAFVATAATASQTGTTGTVAYMSPEQAMGRSVDQRSDIWSLGVVLAEMLTGQSPFSGDNIPGIMYAILNEAPRGLDDVHPALQPILYRALAKDPERRYLSCTELLAALDQAKTRLPDDTPALAGTPQPGAKPPKSRTTGRESAELRRAREEASRSSWGPAARRSRAPLWIAVLVLSVLLVAAALAWFVPALRSRLFTPSEKHIAVLPFDNIGSNPENDALAAGLMESLSGRLSNLDVGNQSLWIVPTSEVRARKVTDPADALKQLGANLVIKGAVERDGNNIHLTVNLIDAKNLRQLGSVDVEDPAGDLSTAEDETVARLARLMNLQVTSDMLRNTGGRVNPAAYEDYLTALGYMQRYDKPGNLDQAISTLQNAVKTDPGFALGYGELGEAWRLKNETDPNPKWLTEAEANAEKAVQLDNGLAPVYVTLGHIHHSMGQHDLALEEFQHAYSIDPKNAQALVGMAHVDEDAGKLADAETLLRKAADLQPNDWDGYNNLARFLQRHGNYSQAIAQYKRALQLAPDNAQVLLNLGAAYINTGDAKLYPEAESTLRKSISLNPSFGAYANLGVLYQNQARYRDAADATTKALALNSQNYIVWDNLVQDYTWLNQPDEAAKARQHEIPLLEQAVRQNPRNAGAFALLADLYAQQGQRDNALASLRTALALSPDDSRVLANAIDVYADFGDRTQAIAYLKKALSHGYSKDQVTSDPELQQFSKDPAVRSLLQ
ncbi:MAG TPA: protein kinase [Acidobacteriaceae bacterium]|nr:protein kinase [Acidobacteriaceae bacterium]